MTIYFSSDQHINHIRVLEIMPFRPWKTVEEMNQAIVDNHNSIVKPNDTTIWLGDVLMGRNKEEAFKKYITKMNGNKIWLLGNHDRGFDDFQKALPSLKLDPTIKHIYVRNINFSDTQFTDTTKIVLSHFPFLSEMHEEPHDRHHQDYRPYCAIDDGESILFHGHNHSQVPMYRSRMINVGVDAWNYFPVSLETLLAQVEAFDRYPTKDL